MMDALIKWSHIMQQVKNIKFPLINALIAFAKDHFLQFGCMPSEFEFDNVVLDFDAYMELLTDDDLHSITSQMANCHGNYPLPEKMGLCSDDYRMWKFCDVHFVPTYHQNRLYQALSQAIFENGLFYTKEVYEFVVDALKDILTPELLARNSDKTKVENGHFGMEIFYMRQIVESHHIDAENRDALSYLIDRGVNVGSVLKGPFLKGSATYSTMVVTDIDKVQGTLSLVCRKRGSPNKWAVNVGAMCPRLQACVR